MLILGHADHWLVSLAYFAPVAGFLAWLGWVTIKERRSGAQDDHGG